MKDDRTGPSAGAENGTENGGAGVEPCCRRTGDSHDGCGRTCCARRASAQLSGEGDFLPGWGNPLVLAMLEEGERVIELGCGAGFDTLLAARRVGRKGRVVGIDESPDLIEQARRNMSCGEYENVEFRVGALDNLPERDGEWDVVFSDCALYAARDRKRVFAEAFRVLRPGGRLLIADAVLGGEIPARIMSLAKSPQSSIFGAALKDDYMAAIGEAGFVNIEILRESPLTLESIDNDPAIALLRADPAVPRKMLKKLENLLLSVNVCAEKPGETPPSQA